MEVGTIAASGGAAAAARGPDLGRPGPQPLRPGEGTTLALFAASVACRGWLVLVAVGKTYAPWSSLLAAGMCKMAGSVSGCRGELKVVGAALPVACACFSSVACPALVVCGLWGCWKGREKSLCSCGMTVTPAGAVTSLEASSRLSPACPLPSNGGNPNSSLLVQTVAVFCRRPLLGGTVRIDRGVP